MNSKNLPWLLGLDSRVVEDLQGSCTVVVAIDSPRSLSWDVREWGHLSLALGLVCLAHHNLVVAAAEWIVEQRNRPAYTESSSQLRARRQFKKTVHQ